MRNVLNIRKTILFKVIIQEIILSRTCDNADHNFSIKEQ